MELRQLRYFARIVETGSMGRAALDLNIGVSALSQQIARLENELAIRLLQRTSRGVTPTSAGLAFYSQAQLALRHADDAILAAREARLSGHVSVGMAPSTASVLGVPFINAMRELPRRPPAPGGKPLRESGADDQHPPAGFSHRLPAGEDPALERQTGARRAPVPDWHPCAVGLAAG